MKISCNQSNPPLGGLLAAEFYKSSNKDVELTWGSESVVTLPNAKIPVPYGTSNDLIRVLENAFNKSAKPLQKVTMNHWLSFSLVLDDEVPKSLEYLDKTLGPLTYLVGESLSVADLAVFSVLHVSNKYKEASKSNIYKNIARWMKLVEAQPPVAKALKELPSGSLETMSKKTSRLSPQKTSDTSSGRLQEGKFIELPNAEMGKVVVRFPPEASGYLHIGHAKAALLNQYYQQAFNGKLIMRFDDTNPAKENADFEKVILEDVQMLEIKPDMFTHTSQYFDLMLEYCEKLIREGKAFVDDTPAEQMKNERDQKTESKNRNNSVERNLQLWAEMQKASAIGVQCCVRAKIDMQSANGCLRDPTIYRCKPEVHPRTGTKYKVYPTYDFACPIVDSIEGVTHVLRTMEYHDRDPQFYWFIDAIGLRKPYIWEYSRLSMTYTVLSKRKLTWFVEQGLVDGWDDPRMPTVRGVLRRGMTVEGLRQFIQAQGSSRSVVFMEWDKIWAINKKVIDPVAPRYTTLEQNPVPVNLKGVSDSTLNVPLHPKKPDIGNKTVHVSQRLLIDQVDAKALKKGENATFVYYGNVMINEIHKAADGTVLSIDATPNLENKDYKKTVKLTWLADSPKSPMLEVYCVYFDHIISKALLGKDEDFKQYIGHPTRWEIPMIGEPELAKVKKGDIIQLQRRGFFRADVAAAPPSPHTCKSTPLVLFHVPDGHTKGMPGQPKPEPTAQAKQPAPAKTPAKSATVPSDAVAKQGEVVRSITSVKVTKPEIDEVVKTLLDLKAQFRAATGQNWAPASSSPKDDNQLYQKVAAQGETVRSLKAAKSPKPQVEAAVKQLLELKAQYKAATGQDWAPEAKVEAKASSPPKDDNQLYQKVAAQGETVRSLKAAKSPKPQVEAAVKQLLELKAQYKAATGQDWAPGAKVEAKASSPPKDDNQLYQKVAAQGETVRSLKAAKSPKPQVEAAVKQLLELKAQYKAATGQDWAPGAKVEAKASSPPKDDNQLYQKVAAQGEIIRSLKAAKSPKPQVDAAVKELLELKAQYKSATGQDWTPQPAKAADAPKASNEVAELNSRIAKQGDEVRSLKSAKADKTKVNEAVKVLLELKAKYKELSGQDWVPNATAAAPGPAKTETNEQTIVLDGKLSQPKEDIEIFCTKLKGELNTKDFADMTSLLNVNVENPPYNPDNDLNEEYALVLSKIDARDESRKLKIAKLEAQRLADNKQVAQLIVQIAAQGDKIRRIKAEKAEKSVIDVEVKNLLNLKAQYKAITKTDWTPNVALATATPAPTLVPGKMNGSGDKATALGAEVSKQGDLVRELKTKKADKASIDEAVKKLLELKAQYLAETGTAYAPPAPPRDNKAKDNKAKEAKPKEAKEAKPKEAKPKENKEAKLKEQSPKPVKEESASGVKKITRLGLEASKDTDLPEWYSQVITKSEMIDYYDISGCYILRPWSYSMWDKIRTFLTTEFKKLGVKDGYFPIFVSKAVLEREKTHIADFAPEVAWVTHSGSSELAEHIAIRPTSETVMYPAYARWIQSHRDLPFKLNQWNNVVRWEFKQPQPFLRTREFLWQEGHTAYRFQEEAAEEVMQILELYAQVYEDLLAVPVIKGRKTEKEKFAGGDWTTTVEAYVPASGRAIQGATSHHLGQNFSKMFEVVYDDPDTHEKAYVYQNSWGITTRTIGVMVLVHGDDRGLVLPPRIADIQAIVVPCGITVNSTQEERKTLIDSCKALVDDLVGAGIRAEGDYRDNYSPGWKFNHWELKGVPIRVELGPKDMAKGEVVCVRRLTGDKRTLKRADAGPAILTLLEETHKEMLAKATKERDARLSMVNKWEDFTAALERKHILLAPFCGDIPCEDQIKNDSARTDDDPNIDVKAPAMGAKSLCIPFKQPRELTPEDRCIHPACKNKPKFITLFGRSY